MLPSGSRGKQTRDSAFFFFPARKHHPAQMSEGQWSDCLVAEGVCEGVCEGVVTDTLKPELQCVNQRYAADRINTTQFYFNAHEHRNTAVSLITHVLIIIY